MKIIAKITVWFESGNSSSIQALTTHTTLTEANEKLKEFLDYLVQCDKFWSVNPFNDNKGSILILKDYVKLDVIFEEWDI
jgi:hypothetical protein